MNNEEQKNFAISVFIEMLENEDDEKNVFHLLPKDKIYKLTKVFPLIFGKRFMQSAGYLALFNESERVMLLSEFKDQLRGGFSNCPTAIECVPKDQVLTVLKNYQDIFELVFTTNKMFHLLRLIPRELILEVFVMFQQSIVIGFRKCPYAIELFPDDMKLEIVKRYKNEFKFGFTRSSYTLNCFPKDIREKAVQLMELDEFVAKNLLHESKF